MAITKGFIKDFSGNTLLPITRGELVLDSQGNIALTSSQFLAGENGNQYGLITAAERAMLTSGSTGGGISDIYTKLDHINEGLLVGTTTLNFYNKDTGAKTPINIVSSGAGHISITTADNVISFALAELNTTDTTVTQIIKGITVDKYGRVTSVTGANLENSDIPDLLTGKTLSGCLTNDSDIGTNDRAIANKAYVDSKFNEVTNVATGALKFGGALTDATIAGNALKNSAYLNHYFKVTKEFQLSTTLLYDVSGITGTEITVKVGDTLIVYSDNGADAKFVYIPSGNDITTLSVYKDGEVDKAVDSAFGDVGLRFSSVFSVTSQQGSKNAYIALSPASSTTDGYLSKEDWIKFNSYSSSLSTIYTGAITPGDGVYTIGTLTIGGVDNIIYGKNNITALSLNNGEVNEYNPILKFSETGSTDVDITFAGLSGITVKKEGNVVGFAVVNEVIEQAVPQVNNPRNTKYLTITDGNKFGVQLGSVDEQGRVTDGLTDFSQFNALVNKVAAMYVTFDYSLKGSASTTEYRYGNQKLKEAIDITI